MRCKLAYLLLTLCYLFASVYSASAAPVSLKLFSNNDIIVPPVPLNDEDSLWLVRKRSISIAIYGPEKAPLSTSDITGRYRGMNADYLQLMKNALGVALTLKCYPDRQSAVEALRGGKVDLVLTDPDEADITEPSLVASLPLVKGYPALVSRQTEMMKPLHSSDQRVTIAITQHYPSEDFIKRSFPRAIIVSYPTVYQALESVVKMRSDYYIGNNIISSFIISRDFNHLLEMTRFWQSPQNSNRFLAADNQRKLIKIINSFLHSLNEPLHNQIAQSWVEMGSLTFLTRPLDLTPQEKRWLEKHQRLRVLVNPYYAPLNLIDSNNEIRGIVGDIMNLIHLQTGLTFEPVIANSNKEMAHIMRKGAWDIVPSATYSPERADEIAFSHPFISTPFVIVMRSDAQGPVALKPGMKVAIPVYHTLSEKLRRRYPGIEWLDVANTCIALSLVAQGKVDAAITTQLTSRYLIDHYYSGKLDFSHIPEEPPAQISFALPRGEPELQSIINKALDDIPAKEVLDIAGKWTSMPNVQIETWNLYSRPFYWVVGLATLLVLICLMWGAYLLNAVRRRKASEAALEYQLTLRQTLFNAIPVPVYVMTAQGELDSYNHAFATFFSPELHDNMRLSMFDRRHPLAHIFPQIQHEVEEGLTPDRVIPHQTVLHNGKEERLVLHWMTLCRLPASRPPQLLCGWQDITESRQLMQALQAEKDKAIRASQAKSSFLASMSHEIRTPVSAIMGFLELISSGNQSPKENEESIKLAWSTAQSLIGLIGEVLDMEKIESGKLELKPEWIDIKALIGSTLRNFEGLAIQKKLHLSGHYRLPEEKALWLDPQAIKQILSNLISNAIKFTTEGGVQIFADVRMLEDGHAQLTLRVQDSGVGISEQEQKMLYKPFSQASSGKQHTGSGLGLVISRELTQLSGGDMHLTSLPGVGTIVTVTLTTRISELIAGVSVLTESVEELPKNLRILIVDDHATNRLLLKRQLIAIGYEVMEAKDGIEALNLINSNTCDLMITDINMPLMDGITLTQRVREVNQTLIIWGLTANALPSEKERCLRSGMNACLFKPVHLKQLQRALGNLKKPSAEQVLSNLIDMETVYALALNDTALIRQMLEQSCSENEKDIVHARSAMLARNWQQARYSVHRINGTAQLIGAGAIHDQAEQLENALAIAADPAKIESQMHSLEQRLNELNAAIKNFLSNDGGQ